MSHRKPRHGLLVLVGALFAVSGCLSDGPVEIETGPGAEITAEGLHRLRNTSFRNAWVKPDAEFADYDRIQLAPIAIKYKRKPSRSAYHSTNRNFALRDDQQARLADLFLDVFTGELAKSDHFGIAEQSGPRVLRLEASIIDLVVKVPTQTLGNERTFTTSTGEMTLLLELFDSPSGEILARVADRQEARAAGHGGFNDLYYSNPATDGDAVRRVFQRWAEILRRRLDEVHELEPSA
jgi:hypothetical protein